MRKKQIALFAVQVYNPNTKQLSATFDGVIDSNGNMVSLPYYKKNTKK